MSAEMETAIAHAQADGFPWPPGPGEDYISAAGRLWAAIMLRPAALFRRMPDAPPTGPALVFYLAVGLLAMGVGIFWDTVLGVPDFLGMAGATPTGLQALWQFLLAPLLLLITLYLAAGVTHLVLRMVGGANRSFATTRNVFAFAYAPQLLAVIPWVGPWIGFPWMVVVAIIGLREAHRADGWRAGIAVLVPLVLMLGLAGAFFLIALASEGFLFGISR